MKVGVLAAVAAGLALGANAQGLRELSFMTAMPAAKAPVIDGSLDDACWAKGIPNKAYYKLDLATPPRVKLRTECTVVYDAKGIYVGIKNWEDHPEKLVKNCLKDWDPRIWYDDGGEIYFDPDCASVGFYKYDLSCTGKHYTLWRMDPANIHGDWRSPGVVSAAKIYADRFEIELFVPWGDFHGRPAPTPGTMWKFNHNRFQWHTWTLCCSAPGASYTTPERFGYLYFSDGSTPDREAILKMILARCNTSWGIEIEGKTYLHDEAGFHPIEGTIAELAERKKQEKKTADAIALTNFHVCCETTNYVPKMALPLAGQYDFTPPKKYDGYNGWARHNPDFEQYKTPHLDWADAAAGRKTKVLFLSGWNNVRDSMELMTRFPIDGMIFPGNFGADGQWEDAVKGGTFLDKGRQLQTFLARNPDVTVWRMGYFSSSPMQYRCELMRRVRDEGMGLLILEVGWCFQSYCGIKNFRRDGEVVFNGRTYSYKKFGKGTVIYGEYGPSREIGTDWAANYETRLAELFRMIQSVSPNRPALALRAACDVRGALPVGNGTNFIAIAAKATDGAAVFGRDVAAWRVRNEDNATVLSGEQPLSGKGETGVIVPLENLPGGNYFLDVMAKRGGGLADALSLRFVRERACGRFYVASHGNRVKEKSTYVPLRFVYTKGAPRNGFIRYEIADMPYGQVRYRNVIPATGRDRLENIVRALPFPTLAGRVKADLCDAQSNVVATARAFLYFPNTRFEDYTLISWDGLSSGGNLAPLLAPQLVEKLGYRANLGENGGVSALMNSRSLPNVAAVSISGNAKKYTKWSTLRGFITPWGGPLANHVSKLGEEITPYDPEVQAIVAEAMTKVTNSIDYGACVWNLGDENGFSYDIGMGPKDRDPFARFLEKKYGTLAAFNKAHATNATSFATAAHKSSQQAKADRDWPSYFDHAQFCEQIYIDCHHLLAKEIKKYEPTARVGAEGSGPGDLEKMVEGLGFWGPYGSSELLRCIKPNLVRGIWWGGYFTNLRDGFPSKPWEFNLTGTLNADMFFQAMPGGTQSMFCGDYCLQPYVEKMRPYLTALRRGQAQLLLKTPYRDDGVALWSSHESNHAAKLADEFTVPDRGSSAFLGYCYRSGIAIRYVTKNHLDWLKSEKVVFLAGACALTDAEVAALKAFRKRGGLIAADCEPGILDGFLARRAEAPLRGLWTKFDPAKGDRGVAEILAQKGIKPRETIAGLPADQCLFRVRQLGDMRVAGFKTSSRALGCDVTIDFGEKAFVYEVDKGFVGETAKVALKKIAVPFRLFSAFSEAQAAPTVVLDKAAIKPGDFVKLETKGLRKGSVYRLEVVTPGGAAVDNRERVFAADGKPVRFQFPYSDAAGAWKVRLVDVATGLAGEASVAVE